MIHIVLLDPSRKARKARSGSLHAHWIFGPLQTFWINQSCHLCSASLNERLEDADVLWVYSEDPLSPGSRSKLLNDLRKAKPGARVINHPDDYNAYHRKDAFERLAKGGVSVPRHTFFESDLDKTKVVYKRTGQHTGPKTLEKYTGPRAGYEAFEFIDSRGPDGRFRKYRVYYIVGTVRPDKLMLSEHWNVHLGNASKVHYVFAMTTEEIRQVRAIAKSFSLQYFAVDFLRRSGDDHPFFIDVNIYPNNRMPESTTRHLGYHGSWHTFDARQLLQIAEPGGKCFAGIFDEAMRHFMEDEPFPSDPNSLC